MILYQEAMFSEYKWSLRCGRPRAAKDGDILGETISQKKDIFAFLPGSKFLTAIPDFPGPFLGHILADTNGGCKTTEPKSLEINEGL